MENLFVLPISESEKPAIPKPTTHNGLRSMSQTDLNTLYVVPSTGKCTSSICPLPFPHIAGRYYHLGLGPLRDEYSHPFGTSNPPPEIRTAWQRVVIARTPWQPIAKAQAQWLSAEELEEDQKAVAGFLRLHAGAYYGPQELKVDGGFLRLNDPSDSSCGLEGMETESIRKSESRTWVAEDHFSDDTSSYSSSGSPMSVSKSSENEIDYPEEDVFESNFEERKSKREVGWKPNSNSKPKPESKK